ncbi:hypothetical protein TNCV_3302971 [Trichonephila clavipes]|nr:hypothetical protein TNCV_3302971 [Trichonephila clavipes]
MIRGPNQWRNGEIWHPSLQSQVLGPKPDLTKDAKPYVLTVSEVLDPLKPSEGVRYATGPNMCNYSPLTGLP